MHVFVMHLLLEILSGMANSLIWVYTVCMYHFVRNLGKHMGLTKAGLNSGMVIRS